MDRAYITVDVDVQVEDRGTHWAASIPAFGMTVYGDTEELAQVRLEKSLKFYMDNFLQNSPHGISKLRAYLDAHDVSHKLDISEVGLNRSQQSTRGYSVRRESRIAVSGVL